MYFHSILIVPTIANVRLKPEPHQISSISGGATPHIVYGSYDKFLGSYTEGIPDPEANGCPNGSNIRINDARSRRGGTYKKPWLSDVVKDGIHAFRQVHVDTS